MVYEARLDTFATRLSLPPQSRDGKSDQEMETSGQLKEEENSSYSMSTSRERVVKKNLIIMLSVNEEMQILILQTNKSDF